MSDPAVLDILEPSSPATEPYTQSADNVQPASCRRWSVTGRAKTGGRKPWYRYVPLNPDLTVQTVGPDGEPCIIDDTLACLAHAEPDTDATPPVLTAEMYTAAFQAWAVARQHLYDRWMWQTDPANLAPQIPRAMRDAAALVMAKGEHLGDAQDALGSRLNAPYPLRIQREVRHITFSPILTDREKIDALLELADRYGLTVPSPPPIMPVIEKDDIYLVCWTAIIPADISSP